jgi:glycosyltransferase involved in cell wall biosynthesis
MGNGQSGTAGVTEGPLVCVLLCTRDDGPTIERAIDSVQSQTLARERFELLVIDDASEDATPDLLRRYAEADPRIRVHRPERNLGLVGACNLGLELIEAPYFVRLDGDDRFEPRLLEALVDAAEDSGADVVSCDRHDEDPAGHQTVRRLNAPRDLSGTIAIGTLMRTALVRELGGYRPMFWEEYDLYLRLLKAEAQWRHVPEPLVVYSVGDDGRMTADVEHVARGWNELAETWPEDVLGPHGFVPWRT